MYLLHVSTGERHRVFPHLTLGQLHRKLEPFLQGLNGYADTLEDVFWATTAGVVAGKWGVVSHPLGDDRVIRHPDCVRCVALTIYDVHPDDGWLLAGAPEDYVVRKEHKLLIEDYT